MNLEKESVEFVERLVSRVPCSRTTIAAYESLFGEITLFGFMSELLRFVVDSAKVSNLSMDAHAFDCAGEILRFLEDEIADVSDPDDSGVFNAVNVSGCQIAEIEQTQRHTIYFYAIDEYECLI